ncbi:MAG: hypothetical protein JW940_16845 [Polyangiaceae bacterium]|nr:hypothetical protein [Polyangiaceae bacterium]
MVQRLGVLLAALALGGCGDTGSHDDPAEAPAPTCGDGTIDPGETLDVLFGNGGFGRLVHRITLLGRRAPGVRRRDGLPRRLLLQRRRAVTSLCTPTRRYEARFTRAVAATSQA